MALVGAVPEPASPVLILGGAVAAAGGTTLVVLKGFELVGDTSSIYDNSLNANHAFKGFVDRNAAYQSYVLAVDLDGD